MRRLSKLSLVAALLLAPTAALAQAPPGDEAVVRFDRGVSLYEAENFEGALVEFSAAYKLTGNYKLLYNIGICQQQTKDYPGAVQSFRSYLEQGRTELSEERKADVQERLSKLSLMITDIRITTDAPAGSSVLVDDKLLGTIPIGRPVTVKIGRRRFSITADGRTLTKTVDVTSGENQPVELLMSQAPAPVVAPAPVAEPVPADAPKPDAGPSFPWPLWAVTGLIGGGAVVTGVLAVDARNEFERQQATFGVNPSSLEDDRSNAQALGIVTDVLIVSGIVSAGIATYFTVRWFGAKDRASAPAAGFYVTPRSAGLVRSF